MKFEGSIENLGSRREVLSAWLIAADRLGEIAAVVNKTDSPSEARLALAQAFSITERQAQIILEFQVQHLARFQRAKIIQEMGDVDEYLSRYAS